MSSLLTSLLFAVLVVTTPFTFILKIMLQLPKPLALSHRRWPTIMDYALIGAITACITVFIRSAYFVRGSNPSAVMMQFVIAGLAYIFGLVLILRQFCGVYPEYIVTTGRTGLSIRKTVYRNITDVEEVSRQGREARLRVITTHGSAIPFTLPTRSVSIFYEKLKPQP